MADNNDPQLAKPINDDEMPSQEEIIEKPYYDNASAPTIQNPTDNNQPQIQNPVNNPPPYNPPIDIQSQYPNQNNIQAPIYNPNNNPSPYYNPNNPPPYYNPSNNQPQYYPPPGTPQQVSQAYPGAGPYYPPPVNYNNNMNYNNGVYYNSQPQVVPRRTTCFQNPITVVCLSVLLIIVVIIDLIIQIISEFNLFILIDDAGLLIIAIIFLILICKRKSVGHIALGAATVIVWFVGFGLRGFGMTQLEESGNAVVFFFLTVIRTFAIFFCIPIACVQGRST
jgi:hypothetical protein